MRACAGVDARDGGGMERDMYHQLRFIVCANQSINQEIAKVVMADMQDRVYFTRIKTPGKRRQRELGSDILEVGIGRRYPKLLLVLCLFVVFLMVSWLPTVAEKQKDTLAFVWPLNQTRETKLLIKPSQISTIIKPQICSHDSPSSVPYLVVVVCSSLANFNSRTAIRSSWARDQTILKGVEVVFLVGQSENFSHQAEIEEEAKLHGDILQEGFIDTYTNLTVKSVMLLKWFNSACHINPKLRSEYLFKTDDDIYVNLPQLYRIARDNKKPSLLMGTLICNAVPIKDPHNKWFVPRYMFKEKKYPNYLSGTGYLMNRETALKLYTAALDTPLFHLEDIYITGILSRSVGIRPIDNVGFSYVRRKLNSCLFRQTVTTHQIHHQEMIDIYAKIQQTKNTKCPVIKTRLLRNYGPGRCFWPRSHQG